MFCRKSQNVFHPFCRKSQNAPQNEVSARPKIKKSKPSLNRQSKGPDKPAPAAHNGWFWLLLWSFNTNPGFPDRTVSAIPPRPHPRATSANIQIPTSAATAPLRPAPLSPLEVPPNQRRMNNTLSCRMKENRP